MSMLRNFANVGGATLVSRVLGFVRDMLMAAALGTGPVADAFFAAFRFPNLFRRLFAEGAFNAAFVPLFSKALEQGGEEPARQFAREIISWLIAFLLVLTVLAEIFMPWLLVPFVPGFLDDPEIFDLTVLLTRICFPYLACMSLMAAYGAMLNGLRKFFIAAIAPALLNVVLIIALGLLVLWAESGAADTAIWVSVGVIVGGVAQLALVAWGLSRTGYFPGLVFPRFNRNVARFWVLALPAILTGGITQINIFVGTIIASIQPSAISYLYYADRLYQLPLGIIGIAIGIVLLPELSRHLKGGRLDDARRAQDQSLLFALLLTVPAAVALAVIAGPVISVLFERGAFDAGATRQTAAALMAFSFGLPGFVLVKVFQPGFFAREDTATPTLFAAISAGVNIALSVILFPQFAHVGIAIATSIAAWVNVVLLATRLAARGQFTVTGRQWRRYGLLLVSAAIMGLAVWAIAMPLGPFLETGAGLFIRILALGALVIAGIGFYLVPIHLTGVQRIDRLIADLTRKETPEAS
ncbi:murein biosynthesis integral membrane protein MurJ [Cucumibacter marinus]|uniref:murein biosynthesis integral membrane protein MurJ n=1 Tax=Cucumibacter marinus TaxID=1121252 RepID=UPI00048FFF85|nr:murein biosynthesis integral membrane protein MurJ [Cucumibacter marinus]